METTRDLDAVRAMLAEHGQEHLLAFFDELDGSQRDELLADIVAVDFDALPGLIDRFVRNPVVDAPPTDLAPAKYYPIEQESARRADPPGWDRAAMERIGRDAIAAGKVAVFTVAGGQGTRLGHDGPKGGYPTGCVTDKPLFQIFAEGVRAAGDRAGVTIPWYIMTSPLNHDDTVAYFERHDHFGLDAEDVMFFRQGVMPSMCAQTGRLLLGDKHRLATNPDGHGGSIRALWASGAIDDMRARGVEHISYAQVDNPHCRLVDPVFLGLHIAGEDSSAQISSKMVPKAGWDEKVGVFCESAGRACVIEYSDLPDELAKQTDEHGTLRFNAGSIAIHIIGVEFVEKMSTDEACGLPYHRAVKKVGFVDAAGGERVEPGEPNAVKLERFIFDAIPLAEASIVYETDRVEEFAPVKNATGADSIVTSKALQTERAARWLEAAGIAVPRKTDGSVDAVIEISPLTATCAGELGEALSARRADPPRIEAGARITL